MNTKDTITREQLEKNMMKNVIFRLDFQGIINLEDILKGFQQNFKGKFKDMETTYHNHIDLQIVNFEEISESLSIPVKELERQEIFQFSNNQFGNDTLTFNISKYFASLNVECVEYKCIDEYLNFFSSFADFLIETCDFLKFKRIGLRKVSGKIYLTPEAVFRDFEKKYLNFDFGNNFKPIRSQYLDFLQKNDHSPIVNYKRLLSTGMYFDVDQNKSVSAYQIQLDIDGYLQEDLLPEKVNKGQIKGIFEDINVNHLFNLFKMSVTEEFLNEHIRKTDSN